MALIDLRWLMMQDFEPLVAKIQSDVQRIVEDNLWYDTYRMATVGVKFNGENKRTD